MTIKHWPEIRLYISWKRNGYPGQLGNEYKTMFDIPMVCVRVMLTYLATRRFLSVTRDNFYPHLFPHHEINILLLYNTWLIVKSCWYLSLSFTFTSSSFSFTKAKPLIYVYIQYNILIYFVNIIHYILLFLYTICQFIVKANIALSYIIIYYLFFKIIIIFYKPLYYFLLTHQFSSHYYLFLHKAEQ